MKNWDIGRHGFYRKNRYFRQGRDLFPNDLHNSFAIYKVQKETTCGIIFVLDIKSINR